MKISRYILAIIISVSAVQAAQIRINNPIKKQSSSFAIIIDQESYSKTEKAVAAYRDAIEADGLSCYTMVISSAIPDEIRAAIIELKTTDSGLEGVVFVGDIPVPMIRDAQHLASAFKMDQERYPYPRSSIASDRFYDDFDLKFKFLEQDTVNTLLYYYSLTAESCQIIEREIYSGRIKPSETGENKYEILSRYLNRIARQKSEKQRLDHMLRFNGHGYNSESLTAWENESIALREQLPNLYQPEGSIKSLYHEMSPDLKTIIINELQKPELDFALFHAHGGIEAQYFLGYPPATNIGQNIDAIKMFIRGKIREAKRRKRNVDESIKYYQDQYDIPTSWFEGVFDDSVMTADSIYSSNLDMDISDVSLFKPEAELIIFDECFNGSFQKDKYIAGKYVFGNGNVIVGVANSVNVKQDVWTDEGLGMLNYNIRIGQWHQDRAYLETHIIGDPTFRFNNPGEKDWSELIQKNADNIRFWQKTVNSNAIPLRSLAVRKIVAITGKEANQQLLNIYKNDKSFVVRLSAIKGLAKIRSKEFENLLFESANDPYELIRRFSVQWMGVVGREDYLPVLVQKVVNDPSDRVSYLAKGAIEKIGPDKVYPIFENEIRQLPDLTANRDLLSRMKDSYERTTTKLRDELIPEMTTDTLKLKVRINAVRTLRNYQYQEALPVLIALVLDENEPVELRVSGLEAFGWYAFSYNRNDILQVCETLVTGSNILAEVISEALKTQKRLIAGYTDPVNP